jgi:hypothetical protein
MSTINHRRPDLRARRRAALAARAKRQATRDPTPEEIAAFCAEFQARWSTAEKRFRSVEVPEWTPPELCCVDFSEG